MKDNDWTQLQFTMSGVTISEHFPLGVKTTYRKYCQPEVLLIEQSDEEGMLGFKVMSGESHDQPAAIPPNVPEGMFVLRSLPPPETPLRPCPFLPGSRSILLGVVAAMKRTYTKLMPEVVQEWEQFRDLIAPQDDDADRYVVEKGMKIPLFDELFSAAAVQLRDTDVAISRRSDREHVIFTASVQWTGRGEGAAEIANSPFISAAGSSATAPTTVTRITGAAAPTQRGMRRSRSPQPKPARRLPDCPPASAFCWPRTAR